MVKRRLFPWMIRIRRTGCAITDIKQRGNNRELKRIESEATINGCG